MLDLAIGYALYLPPRILARQHHQVLVSSDCYIFRRES